MTLKQQRLDRLTRWASSLGYALTYRPETGLWGLYIEEGDTRENLSLDEVEAFLQSKDRRKQ